MHMALSRLLDCTLWDPQKNHQAPGLGPTKNHRKQLGAPLGASGLCFVCFILPTDFKIEPAYMKNERINKHAMFRAELPVHVFRLEA